MIFYFVLAVIYTRPLLKLSFMNFKKAKYRHGFDVLIKPMFIFFLYALLSFGLFAFLVKHRKFIRFMPVIALIIVLTNLVLDSINHFIMTGTQIITLYRTIDYKNINTVKYKNGRIIFEVRNGNDYIVKIKEYEKEEIFKIINK